MSARGGSKILTAPARKRRRIFAAAMLASFTFHAPSAATCNDGSRLDSFLFEWLKSKPAAVSLTRQRLIAASRDGGTSAHIDSIKKDYVDYFGNRAAPASEIGFCDTVQLVGRLNFALSRFP
jgi:hypothetical protein